MRTATITSVIAGASAYLLAAVAKMPERSIVVAVIVIVSTLAWMGFLDGGHRPPTRIALPVRASARRRLRPEAREHATMPSWEDPAHQPPHG